jgi:hypothetical protein
MELFFLIPAVLSAFEVFLGAIPNNVIPYQSKIIKILNFFQNI